MTKLVEPTDLIIDVYRTSEMVNQGAHAVRITHKPTGIVVKSETPAPSWVNREKALEMLVAEIDKRKL